MEAVGVHASLIPLVPAHQQPAVHATMRRPGGGRSFELSERAKLSRLWRSPDRADRTGTGGGHAAPEGAGAKRDRRVRPCVGTRCRACRHCRVSSADPVSGSGDSHGAGVIMHAPGLPRSRSHSARRVRLPIRTPPSPCRIPHGYRAEGESGTSEAAHGHRQASKGISATQETGGFLPIMGSKWSGRRDSNPRPPVPQTDALPDCATARPERRETVPASG